MKHIILSLGIALSLTSPSYAWEASGSGVLIELYTSEGCSSCPPSDAWLTRLKQRPGLWTDFVPLAFHVDYWDGLGWPDKFASGQYTRRQRSYAQRWGTSTIFTPAIITQGENTGAITNLPKTKYSLKAAWNNNRLTLITDAPKDATVHVAWLAMGVINKVKRGENAGRNLEHDFIVLNHVELGALNSAQSFNLTKPTKTVAPIASLAVWIEHNGRPLIAVGGPI